ncbi:MAG: MFS transporter [Gammaproteobacteria bacterium]|nr:MFS transporter [Gammaproteobacteria bacterium]MCW8973661.1 MFS transporter [Gammaproteobacteria bacterium]MCW8992458.1 MFS transporter [Gammaproteobacteria bacterium]
MMQSREPDAHRNILLLGVVSFINDTSSKIIMPLLPLFIAQQGGTGLAIGLIAGLSDSIASITKLLAGYWSDRLERRKPFVITGYLFSSVAKLLLAFSVSWQQTLLLRISERLGKGLRSAPRDALLAAATHKGNRGRGFGIHRAMDSGGALLGTLLVLALYWFADWDFQAIFLFAGLLGFVSLLPLVRVQESANRKLHRTPLRLRELPRPLKHFMLIAFTYALGNFSYMFFILRAESTFDARLAVALPLLLYALYQLSYTLFAIPAGLLSDRIGRRRVLLIGYGLFTLLCLGFLFGSSLSWLLVLFLLYGINFAFVNATERALVADLVSGDERGTALGTFHMTVSLAALPAGLLAGLLWDAEPLYTFIAGALLSAVALLLLATMPAYEKEETSV